jgi:cytochrome c oxidase assembly protein subunit 15
VESPNPNPWLNRFAWLTAATTLGLVCLGGVVTSKGVGMAVPDWPTTLGDNMFFFPPSQWVGGIFYEHTHRLLASAVGLLVTVLAVWLWLAEKRVWVKRLGVVAFALVVFQGVLGGLRVVLDKHGLGPHMGIFHGVLAQLFFVLMVFLALATTRWWRTHSFANEQVVAQSRLAGWFLAISLVILTQLTLGATMRHQHAGLAVPDFPLAYGTLWPAMDTASTASYNAHRMEAVAYNPITPFNLTIHMLHRYTALVILVGVCVVAWRTWRRLGGASPWTKGAVGWLGLILVQVVLGAFTVWSGKKVDVTTAHVAVGAASLAVGALLALTAWRCVREHRFANSSQSPRAYSPKRLVAADVTSIPSLARSNGTDSRPLLPDHTPAPQKA